MIGVKTILFVVVFIVLIGCVTTEGTLYVDKRELMNVEPTGNTIP